MQTGIIHEKQDLTNLSWSSICSPFEMTGSFLKAASMEGSRKTCYKLSSFDPANGIVGHECVNELIADRLLTELGIDHFHYQLIHADSTLKENEICSYDEFALLLKSEGRCAQDSFYISEITL